MIENYNGFTKSGNWYKGNLHSHTTNSDGFLTPDEAVSIYKKHGYSFICFSEHDLYTDYSELFNTKDFLVLPGLEASALLINSTDNSRIKTHHIHGVLGTSQMQRLAEASLFKHMERLEVSIYKDTWNGACAAQKLTDTLRSKGCFTIYNHPVWSRVEPDEFIYTNGLTAIEVFNYNTVNESGTGYDTFCLDMALRKGIRINSTAADDNHNEGLFDDAYGGWICVNADKLEHDKIVTAIMNGNYYSSSGPELLDWGIQNNTVFVKCSLVQRINIIAGGTINSGISIVSSHSTDELTYAEYHLKGNESYIRVECIDSFGKAAWSNPIFLDKITDCYAE